jgi:adenylate cyclase
VERKLAAILCADVYGYSRLMGEDEEATLRTLTSHRKLLDSQIEQHHGRFVNSAGDSVLAEFASVVEAVNCAVEIQTGLKAENASLPIERRMEFRIGVNLGDVMVEGEQIYGDGVNVAARLESLAEPGGICISDSAYAQVKNKLLFSYEDLGAQSVKNIAEPVRVYRVLLDGAAARRKTRRIVRKYRRAGALSLVGLAIVIGTVVLVQHLSFKPQTTHASIPPQEKLALPLPSIPSIAVLPFTNLSADPQQDYFSDGISDQLINNLSRLPGLFVIARNSSFAYKGRATKEQEIGKELGVKYVLEGSVHKEADKVRIGVELVDASNGTEKWTAGYDRPLKDIFAVQDEIVGNVVTTLGLLLKLDEMKLPQAGNEQPTQNLEAFDDLLRGTEYLWRATKDDNAKAREWAEKAIELDPNFAQAYALLGWTYLDDAWDQWSENPLADLKRSMTEAREALALDDSNVNALALVSDLDWMQCRFDQAVADGERAVAVNPNYAQGYLALSDALVNDRKPEAALRAAEKAMRLDPAGHDFYAYAAGNAYNQLGRYQEAAQSLEASAAAHPNMLVAHLALIGPYLELGRDEDARAEASEVMRISPQFVVPPPTTCWTKDAAWNKHMQDELRKAGLK